MASSVRISRIQSSLHSLRQSYDESGLQRPLDLGMQIYQTLCGGAEIRFPLELLFDQCHREEFCFPYELVADERGKQFCRDGKTSLVRVLDGQAVQELAVLPVNILIIVASPGGLPPLNGDYEVEKICSALGVSPGDKPTDVLEHPYATLRVIRGPNTIHQIREALAKERYQIIEFIAHGIDNFGGKGGVLVLANRKGKQEYIDGSSLAGFLLESNHPPSLVILNSCSTGGERAPPPGWFSNVAWQLLVYDIPSVIAMQAQVEDALAAEAAAAFYRTLFSPRSLDECVGAMRLCLSKRWYAPILATCSGFDRRFFAEEWRTFLIEVDKINRKIEGLITNCTKARINSYEELMRYTRELELEYYPLIRERDTVADIIIQHLADELQIML